VCCQGGGQTCQMQSACGMPGNRQICTSNADCPPAYPDCRAGGGGGQMTCRVPLDAGAPADAAPSDAATGG
jgi:hypothetical protein